MSTPRWTKEGDKRTRAHGRFVLEAKRWGEGYYPTVCVGDVAISLYRCDTLADAQCKAIAWADAYKPATVEGTMRDSFEHWPTLYRTRTDVIDGLLFVIGNGYEWLDGALQCTEPEAHLRPLPTYSPEVEALLAEANADTLDRTPRDLYPVCSSSHISRVPDDVRPDWLALAREAAALLAADPKQHAKGAKLVAELNRRFGEVAQQELTDEDVEWARQNIRPEVTR